MPYFELYLNDDDLNVIYSEVADVEEWLQHAVDNKVRWLVDHICYQAGVDPKTIDTKEKWKIVKKSDAYKDGKKHKDNKKAKKKIKYKPSKEDAWRLE